jgi:hypothetical protein
VFVGVTLTYSVPSLLVAPPGVLAEHLDAAATRTILRCFGLGAVPYALLVALAFVSPLAVLTAQGLLGSYYAFDQLDPARFSKHAHRNIGDTS